MRPLRARFGGEILAEFLPPVRSSNRVIILCEGMPTVPSKRPLLEFLSKRGYWALHFRYRGTWESDGLLLRRSPHEDVRDVIGALSRGFRDTWAGKRYRIARPRVYLIGSSFGGAAALLAAEDRRVRAAVALSPVVDWRVESKTEPIDWLVRFVERSFGEVYRFRRADWDKLKRGRFFNPIVRADRADGRKLLIFHAKDDLVVNWKPTADYASRTGADLVLSRRGGHRSLNAAMNPILWRRIRKHFTIR